MVRSITSLLTWAQEFPVGRLPFPVAGALDNDYEFRATDGNIAKFFDVQNKKFTTLSSTRCGYTEHYRGDTPTLSNVLDFFVGG